MNELFGDATTRHPTPASHGPQSNYSDTFSPVPGAHGPDSAIPGLDIDPPEVSVRDGKAVFNDANSETKEGVGGWISNLASRNRQKAGEGNSSGGYERVEQDDDDE